MKATGLRVRPTRPTVWNPARFTSLLLLVSCVGLSWGGVWLLSKNAPLGFQSPLSVRHAGYGHPTSYVERMSGHGGALGGGEPLADGTPLHYEQYPAILDPAEDSVIQVTVEVLGDRANLPFRRNLPTVAAGYVLETWSRTSSRTINGRVVSIFTLRYPATILGDLLLYPHGHDFPQVPLGRLDGLGSEGPATSPLVVWLRIASSDLVPSQVDIVTDESGEGVAQYASHVVNLVIPGFGDSRVSHGVGAFDVEGAAKHFYRDFLDTYHTLAFIPQRSPLSIDDAFNRNVKNDIEGIGAPVMDRQADYGSTMLRSIQLYTAGFLGHHATTLHQIGHHWGDETALASISGITPGGIEPQRHTPLLDGGATLLGAVLHGTRRVEPVSAGPSDSRLSYRIAGATTPIAFHPLQQYRMGLLSASDVAPVTVFVDQSQFQDTNLPAIGTMVSGDTQKVTINEIMAALGVRRGPVFRNWRLAFVVVSDELITAREMNFYNYYARRAAALRGTRSYDGFGTLADATDGGMTLHTAITPRGHVSDAGQNENDDVGYTALGRRDLRGLFFDVAVPARIEAGASITLAGMVDSEILSGEYESLVFRFARYGDPLAKAKTVQASLQAGRFSVPLHFTAAEVGAYALDAFLFADTEGPAIPTSLLTALFVELSAQ